MKFFSILFLLLIFSVSLISAVPELPMIVAGDVYINDKPAKVGTDIIAKISGEKIVEFEVTEKGKFNLLLQKLDKGDEVEFFVNKINSGQSVIYNSGDFEQLTLKVEQSYLIYYIIGFVILLGVIFRIWKRKK